MFSDIVEERKSFIDLQIFDNQLIIELILH